MELFMAALSTETNSFSPLPTGWRAFKEERAWFRNDGSRHPAVSGNVPLIGWRRRAEADGLDVAETLCTAAQPDGIDLVLTTIRAQSNRTTPASLTPRAPARSGRGWRTHGIGANVGRRQ